MQNKKTLLVTGVKREGAWLPLDGEDDSQWSDLESTINTEQPAPQPPPPSGESPPPSPPSSKPEEE